MPKREPVLKSVKKSDPLLLGCEWESCSDIYTTMKDFSSHVTEHLASYLNYTKQLRDSKNSSDSEEMYACYWRECTHEAFPEFPALLRHVYFHLFHSKIKNIGQNLAARNALSECMNDTMSRNVIPEIPDRLTCCWEHCSVVFDDPELFYLHIANHCDVYPSGNNVDGGCRCQWEGCSSVVKSKHKLKDHMKTHTQEKVVACPGCGALFSNMTRFYDHLKRQMESDDHTYQCSHCNKRYPSERLLKDHMRHHVNYYQCPFCDMTCPNPSNLRLHVRYRHSNTRPFICDQCSHSCKTQGDLTRHLDIHKGWIHCVVQDCAFRCHSLANLNRHCKLQHMASEENDRIRFQCHLCHSSYTASFVLTAHLRKKHKFGWPPGHVRFRYKYYEDGFYRLQTVRYESIELTQQILASDIVPETEEVRNGAPAAASSENLNEGAKADVENSHQDIYNDIIITEEEASTTTTKVDYSYNLDLLGDVALKKSTIPRSKGQNRKPRDSKRKRKNDDHTTNVDPMPPRKKRVLRRKQANSQDTEGKPDEPPMQSVIEIYPPADSEGQPSDVVHQGMEQTVILPSGQRILITSNIPVEFADPIVTDESSPPLVESDRQPQTLKEQSPTKASSPSKKRRSGLEEKIEELVAMKLSQNQLDNGGHGPVVETLIDSHPLLHPSSSMEDGRILFTTDNSCYANTTNKISSVQVEDSCDPGVIYTYHDIQIPSVAETNMSLTPGVDTTHENDCNEIPGHGNNVEASTPVILYNIQSVSSDFDHELDPEINRELQKAVDDLMD